MNKIEHEMVEVLKRLRDNYGVFEIKAEFEAEGSRVEELMRLKDVTSKVGLPIILKIGGGEAVTDVYTALSIGVKGIIAPMIETPFALTKYLNMIETVIPPDVANGIEFAFNAETKTTRLNIKEMLAVPGVRRLTGVTVGRVDMSASLGVAREDINISASVFNAAEDIFMAAKDVGLKTGLGGGISKDTLDLIRRYDAWKQLDKFETRKVVFPVEAYKYGEEAIIDANRFELLWLENKRNYHSRITTEDDKRITMLKGRIG